MCWTKPVISPTSVDGKLEPVWRRVKGAEGGGDAQGAGLGWGLEAAKGLQRILSQKSAFVGTGMAVPTFLRQHRWKGTLGDLSEQPHHVQHLHSPS